MTNNKGLIIEFIGSPGAGKTSLMPVVVEYFAQNDITLRTTIEAARPYAKRTLLGKIVNFLSPKQLQGPLLWQVFYHLSTLYQLQFIIKHHKLIRLVLKTQNSRSISKADRDHVIKWFFRLIGSYKFLLSKQQANEGLILDEGFAHRVVQMYALAEKKPDKAQVLAYVDLLPQPDLLIFVKVPTAISEERVYKRGMWEHFKDKSKAEISQYMANAQFVVNLTVDHVKTKGWSIIEVDNSGDDISTAQATLQHKLINH